MDWTPNVNAAAAAIVARSRCKTSLVNRPIFGCGCSNRGWIIALQCGALNMAFPDLIRTPLYQEALKTPDLIERAPASRWAVRESHLLASYKIREAGFRLDHLIRNALNPNKHPDWPPRWRCSAIKAFVEVIEAKLSSTEFANPDEVHAFIDPRLDLAREIVRRLDEALMKEGYSPISSDGFRQEVVVHGTQVGVQIEDLVFENPLCAIQEGGHGPLSNVTEKKRELLLAMRVYWS